MAYLIFSLSLLLIYMGLALALHVQFGMLGIANFGVVGFWGLGMYAMGVFQIQLELSFFDAFLLVALLGFALSWVMGKLILRLDPQAMLCSTIAFAAIVALLVVTEKWATMGVVGLGTIRYPIRIGDGTEYIYFACLLGLIIGLQILVLRLHRSPTGRLLLAIRDNEELCASLGKNTFQVKMFWFIASSLVMCLLGALSAPLNQFLTPNMLIPSVTFAVWIALVLGGKEHSLGALIGIFLTFGVFDILLETYLPVTPDLAMVVPNLKLFLYGLLLIGVLIYRPSGLLAPTTPPEAVWPMIRTSCQTGLAAAVTTVQTKLLGKSNIPYARTESRPAAAPLSSDSQKAGHPDGINNKIQSSADELNPDAGKTKRSSDDTPEGNS